MEEESGVGGEDLLKNVKELQKRSKTHKMWLYSSGFLITSFSVGTTMVFSVTGLPFYQQEKQGASITLDEDRGSWFVSILTIAVMIGSLLSGIVYEKLGSIWTLRLAIIIKILGWILVWIEYDFYLLITGRCLSGLGCGLAIPATYLVLSDISPVRYRGILAVLNSTTCNFGFLVGLITGAVGSLNQIILSAAISGPLFLVISNFLPESPLWLSKQGREKDVLAVLAKLRGPDYPVNVEARELESCVTSEKQTDKRSFADLFRPRFLYPLAIMMTMSVIQGLCGVDSISYYSVKIFQQANLELDAYLMSIFLQIGYTVGYLSVVPFMDRINRKTLFLVSGFIMSTALIILGWTINEEVVDSIENVETLQEVDILIATIHDGNHTLDVQNNQTLNWEGSIKSFLSPVTTVFYSFSYGFGFGSVVCTWSSELFPPDGKILGCSFCLSIRFIIVFVVLKFYPALLHIVGLSKLFWIHAAVTCSGCAFVLFFVPETRGLTLTEISGLFSKGIRDEPLEKVGVPDEDHQPELELLTKSEEAEKVG